MRSLSVVEVTRFHEPTGLKESTVFVSSISSSSDLAQTDWSSLANQWKQDFKQLASAIRSGDLSDAQQAYAAIQQLQQSAQSGGQSSNQQQANSGNNPIQNDFAALGQALQSGDMNAAQSAFSQLQTDMKAAFQNGASGGVQSAHHGHHHHHRSSATDSDSSTTGQTSSSSTDSQSGSTGGTVSIYA
jgi:hypothetical protein